MKKTVSNLLGTFGASFLALWGSGIPAKVAAGAAGIATVANLVGLYQKQPGNEIVLPLIQPRK